MPTTCSRSHHEQALGIAFYIRPNPVREDAWSLLQGYAGLDHGTSGWNHSTGGHAL
jgi:hypothetical protein